MGRGRGWPKDCGEVLGKAAINYSADLARRLRKKINAYRGAGNRQDQGHYDRIQNDCRGLNRLLELIDTCCGPRDPIAQAALDAAMATFQAVSEQCGRVPAPPVPRPDSNPGLDGVVECAKWVAWGAGAALVCAAAGAAAAGDGPLPVGDAAAVVLVGWYFGTDE
jgi:hypothetical protein